MTMVKATAKWDKEGVEQTGNLELDYEFGDNVNAMIEELGAEVVFRHAISSITVALPNPIKASANFKLNVNSVVGSASKLTVKESIVMACAVRGSMLISASLA